jgi:hypothetical protein
MTVRMTVGLPGLPADAAFITLLVAETTPSAP